MARYYATCGCETQQLQLGSRMRNLQSMVAKHDPFSKRLNEACDDAGIVHGRGRTAELHRRCKKAGLNVSSESVRKWLEENSKPRMNNAAALARVVGVNVQWLLTGEGPKREGAPSLPEPGSEPRTITASEEHAPGEDFVPVRRVQIKPSAGVTGYTIEYNGETGKPIFFRADYINSRGWRADQLIALRVNGSSMEPGLYDGDLVVVNTNMTVPRDGHVFVVNYEGEVVLKRLRRDMGEWWLCSDHPDKRRFPDKRLDDEHAAIIGEVVYKQSEVI